MNAKSKKNPALAASVESSLAVAAPTKKPATRTSRSVATKVPASTTPTAVAKPLAETAVTKSKPATPRAPASKRSAAAPTPARSKSAAVAKPAPVAKPAVKTAPATAVAPSPVEILSTEPGHKKKTEGKKGKVIRDTFTIPVGEYQQLAELKQRAQSPGHKVKKSELLRAGLLLLSALTVPQLQKVLLGLESVKTGRPPKK
jgi:hypothetical protein